MATTKVETPRVLVTRAEAKAQGLKRYFTGKPCKHGHIDERLTSNGCCIACGLIRHRAWTSQNIEHAVAYAREWRAEHPEQCRESDRRRAIARPGRTSAYARAWRLANPQRYRKHTADWKKNNPKKVLEGRRRLYWKNPAKAAAKYHRRRTRLSQTAEPFTADDVARIREMQRDRCAICRVRLRGGGHVDHIFPVAKGGSNARQNIQLLCAPCNTSKGASDPVEYMRRRGRLI